MKEGRRRAGRARDALDRAYGKLTGVEAALELLTSKRVAHLAGKGLADPKTLSDDEVRELCGEILRHVRRMEGGG